jgi:hypothetical protein
MKKDRVILIVLTVFLLGIFLLRCAPLGPIFQKIDTIPDNSGLVYIYRPSKGFGSGLSYEVKANGIPITILYNGGYYPYITEPGEIEFLAQTESKSAVTIDVKAAQTYYIRGTVRLGIVVGRPRLIVVSPEVGEQEIAKCKLIQERKKTQE